MNRKFVMLKMFLAKSGYKRASIIKKYNVFHSIGERCYYHPFKLPAEPHLVSFGNNVFIATDVRLVTHNMASAMFAVSIKKSLAIYTGKIEIGNNVFIGAGAMVMPNVKIGNNCVVAAGAVVTRNIPDGEIWGGVPAVKIGNYESLKNKCINYSEEFKRATENMDCSLYDKQIKYFWNKEEH